jgi:UDP-glucose 4-epimerase
VYGPRQNWNLITHVADCARKGVSIRLQGGSQTRDLLYVDDVVRAFVAAAVHKEAWGHAIPLGGGQEITVEALCRKILQVVESDIAVDSHSEKPRATEIWRSHCDNLEAKELLGWTPQIGLTEGLGFTVGEVRLPREKEKVFAAQVSS